MSVMLLPGLSEDYAASTLARLDDRPRDVAEQHLVECLKMLVLLSGHPTIAVAPSPELDSVWRALAAPRAAYAELCSHLPGGRVLEQRDVPRDPCIDESARLVSLYVGSFGPFTPRSALLWPAARIVMVTLRVGLSGLNDAAAVTGDERPGAKMLPVASPWRRLGAVLRISELVSSPFGEAAHSGRM